jgi:PAS domain-containing protein
VAVISAQHFEALTEPDAAGGLAEDSPDTARLQDALAALQAFRSATAGGSVRLTRRGVVAAIDEAAAHLLGLTVEQATGATLNDLIDGDERRRVSVALEDCFEAGVACQLDLAHAGGNGGRSPVTLGIAPVLRNGLVDGVAVAVTPKTTPGARDG